MHGLRRAGHVLLAAAAAALLLPFHAAARRPRKAEAVHLGDQVEISLCTPDTQAARAYYLRLGFHPIYAPSACRRSAAALTDGAVTLCLHSGSSSAPALTYLLPDVPATVRELQSLGAEPVLRLSGPTGAPEAELTDPCGLRVVLATPRALVTLPARAAAVTGTAGGKEAPPSFPVVPSGKVGAEPAAALPARRSSSRCGKFGELALRADRITEAALFWERLGFRRLDGGDTPSLWATYGDGRIAVGLYGGEEFSLPRLTFYSGDSSDRIAALKADGYTFHSESRSGRGEVIAATLEAPGGAQLFISPE